MEVVRQICNKACILEDGKIAAEGSVKSVFIKRPGALKRLLGESDEGDVQSKESVIQVAYDVKDSTLNFLSDMARDLHISFETLGGGIESFSCDKMAIFRLGISRSDREKVELYLAGKECTWSYINQGSAEKEQVM